MVNGIIYVTFTIYMYYLVTYYALYCLFEQAGVPSWHPFHCMNQMVKMILTQ